MILDQVHIGPFIYDVGFESDVRTDEGDLLYGQAVYQDFKIRINKDYQPQRQRTAIIHEILHLINESMADVLEEKDIVMLSLQLIDVCDRNPKLKGIFFPENDGNPHRRRQANPAVSPQTE